VAAAPPATAGRPVDAPAPRRTQSKRALAKAKKTPKSQSQNQSQSHSQVEGSSTEAPLYLEDPEEGAWEDGKWVAEVVELVERAEEEDDDLEPMSEGE
jgi:hypothetical protein